MSPTGWLFLGYLLSDSSKKKQYNNFPIFKRVAASVVDLLIIKATIFVGVVSINDYAWYLIATPIISLTTIFLFSYMESSKIRATPGKLLLGLVSVDLQGMQLSLSKGILRNLIKWLPFLIPSFLIFGSSGDSFAKIWFMINGIVVWLSWSSIQDRIINTAVISRPSYLNFYYSDPKCQIYWMKDEP